MNLFIATILFIHGFAHLIGFIVPWKIAILKDIPYKTTIINGKFDIGDFAIKTIGILWLITAFTFFICSYLLIFSNPLWYGPTIFAILFSFILCILGLPESKIGILVNIFLMLLLFILISIDWIILN